MPKGSTYGNLNYPGGFRHIDRFGPSESKLAQFLYPFAWRDVVFLFDDFDGDDIDTFRWAVGNTNGTAFQPPATQLANGVIQATTGTVAGDEAAIHGEFIWLGDQNCGMEIRWKVDDNTSTQMEVGFSDPLSAYTASAVDDIDTPTLTNGAADVALVAQDTGQTLTTMAFITDGSTANMNVTKTNLGTLTPTNATYLAARVQLNKLSSAVSGSAAFVLDANSAIQASANHGSVLASQIKGSVLMAPIAYWEPLTTAARVIDIDYIACWQDRT